MNMISIVSSALGQMLFEALETRVDLWLKRDAVFSMGDMTYADRYCAVGDRWSGCAMCYRRNDFYRPHRLAYQAGEDRSCVCCLCEGNRQK
jgi:hypothetical protein